MHCWAQSYGRSQYICLRQYHEAVALKWKYFQIIKWIRNQLIEWRASKLLIEGNGVKAYNLKFP